MGGNGVASRKSKNIRKRGQAKKRLTPTKQKRPKKVKLVKPQKVKKVPRPKLVKAGRRDIKAAWNYLKRLGIIKSKRDGRRIKSTDKQAKREVARFDDVLTGKAKAVPLDRKTAAAYRKTGKRVVNNVLIEPKRKGETVTRKKRRIIRRRKVTGGEIVTISVPVSLDQTFADIEAMRDDPDLVDLLNRGYRLSVRFGDGGHWNYGTRYIPVRGVGIDYAIEEMREYIDHYNSPPQSSTDWPSGVYTGSAFEHKALELIAVQPKFRPPAPTRHRRPRSSYHHERQSKKRSRYYKRLKHDPARYQRHLAQVRAAMRRYRAKKPRAGKRHASKARRR